MDEDDELDDGDRDSDEEEEGWTFSNEKTNSCFEFDLPILMFGSKCLWQGLQHLVLPLRPWNYGIYKVIENFSIINLPPLPLRP